MRRFLPIYIIYALAALVVSCADNEYSLSSADMLTFSADTLSLDTVFSTVPAPMKTLWVHNRGKHHITLSSVRLERGNQSGFRVNVDGVFLGSSTGYQTNEAEVRSGDSLRVFVELTSMPTNISNPQKVSDNLVFTLDNGPVQKVNLQAYSWDAQIYKDLEINTDMTLPTTKPIVIYGKMKVGEGATLTLDAGTTLYFHDQASLEVYGRLMSKGAPGKEVVMRGYRLDHMFDYLPYDRVSGQWQGVKIHESSSENLMEYTDIHSSFTGVEIDTCTADKLKLRMNACTVHNCQGFGVVNNGASIELDNCQISNAQNNCLLVNGGIARLNHCTIAQFYPFDSVRGVALSFSSANAPVLFECYNSLVTGYADDEMIGEKSDANAFVYSFKNCVLRTPAVEGVEGTNFENVVFESDDSEQSQGKEHFKLIDSDNLIYDFRLAAGSPSIGAADVETALKHDREGAERDTNPDVGAYEFKDEESQ